MGAFGIRYRPKPDPVQEVVGDQDRQSSECVHFLINPMVSQETPPQNTHTHTHLGLQRDLCCPQKEDFAHFLIPEWERRWVRHDSAAAQEGDTDTHSGCLHEELWTHGGDRYSWRDERKAPHRLTHLGGLPLSPWVPVDTDTCRRAQQLDARPGSGRACVLNAWCALAMVLKREIYSQRKRSRWSSFYPSPMLVHSTLGLLKYLPL